MPSRKPRYPPFPDDAPTCPTVTHHPPSFSLLVRTHRRPHPPGVSFSISWACPDLPWKKRPLLLHSPCSTRPHHVPCVSWALPSLHRQTRPLLYAPCVPTCLVSWRIGYAS